MTTATITLVLVLTTNAAAHEPPRAVKRSVPRAALADLGLGGMQVLTDQQGYAVRGRSIVKGGDPKLGLFTTSPDENALQSVPVKFTIPGTVEHDYVKLNTTTIVDHAHFGSFTAPPLMK